MKMKFIQDTKKVRNILTEISPAINWYDCPKEDVLIMASRHKLSAMPDNDTAVFIRKWIDAARIELDIPEHG